MIGFFLLVLPIFAVIGVGWAATRVSAAILLSTIVSVVSVPCVAWLALD